MDTNYDDLLTRKTFVPFKTPYFVNVSSKLGMILDVGEIEGLDNKISKTFVFYVALFLLLRSVSFHSNYP